MNKKLTIYKISLISMCVVMFGLILAMGMVAVQKSMTLKIGFNINPSFEIKIDYAGETIFCNTTKDGNELKTSSDFTLSGNTLSFKQAFVSLGESFTFTIYNYTTKHVKISVSGTGVSGETVVVSPFTSTAPSEVLTLTASAGATVGALNFEETVAYSVVNSGADYTFIGNSNAIGSISYSASFSTTEYYILPKTIIIKIDGVTLSSSKYTYTKISDNAATLTINSVEGNVEIICEVSPISVEVVVVYDGQTFNDVVYYPNTSKSIVVGYWDMELIFEEDDRGSGNGYSWNLYQNTGGGNIYLRVYNINWSTIADRIEIST